ncbi:MAG: NADH:ubiquinone oxidoreductase subunit J [SAR116 cluster bacterium]|nr:NADH:ubiquinone oxidoreductase subunit J [SAR116 cluster bacterium]RPH08487.1 MAG: NADH-quinone oxidoreductase subunit J [Alphaproteobacteria bacterium TMED54]
MYYSLLFYTFSLFVILSSIGVITSKNPVYCVLYLILSFINSAILFLFLNAEFLAMLLIVVYVGAVAVLFLFVVMMLNINQEETKSKLIKFKPLSIILGTIILIEFLYLLFLDNTTLVNLSNSSNLEQKNNTISLGNIIYTDFALLFQMCGVILLVAMIGAIVLTLRNRPGVRKQIVKNQIDTKKSDVIEVVRVNNNEGA